jgi:16S rRNA C967 or C1407 C5-methylase (RsmB/RsmF family)
MIQLPAAFSESTRQLMGDGRFGRFLKSFEEEPPVSIRLNPAKMEEGRGKTDDGRVVMEEGRWTVADGERVPWCRDGYYLRQRPNFTMDPLLHAGCYYVQEAASMFLDEVLSQFSSLTSRFASALDLCAAPGGKSTLLRSVLPDSCVLYSNEPVRKRAAILLENVEKWGGANHIVTNCYPRDYRASKMCFDIILCDVPCSGEGMFRKDPATIGEWSPQHVEKCWRLQRDIVSDAWQCLKPGGLLVYSTCTFNTKENEENIRWILETYDDAEVLPVDVKPEWNITGSLLDGFHEPVYRFIPGISRGEGLFMCVIRKGTGNNAGKAIPTLKQLQPLSLVHHSSFKVGVDYKTAIDYLRGEAIRLPDDTPRGIVTITFMGHPLGAVKNIGTRANNLYPKEWRIKTTHIPDEYEPILIKI